MARRKTIVGMIGAITAVCIIGIIITTWRVSAARAELADAKARVRHLVNPGQSLGDAEQKLSDLGYVLLYEQAIYPTLQRDYVQQIVVVGDARRSKLDSICYAVGILNPLNAGSPYVVIDASPDGTIIRIE